jgi:multidrug transporter EmrE-like cation transporter
MKLNTLALFAGSVTFQLIGVYLLPISKGLTQPAPTAGLAACFLIGVGLMARLTWSGVNVSVLVPLISTVVPLCSVVIGVACFGDSASWARVGMLVTACVLIGSSSLL